MILNVPFILLLAHWLSDFVFQNDWMALGKSKNDLALAIHSAIVAIVTGVTAAQWLVGPQLGLWFIVITFVCHFWTDYITSRITSKLFFFREAAFKNDRGEPYYQFVGGSRHWFFVMIGFDQLLHYFQLAVTYYAMVYSPIIHL